MAERLRIHDEAVQIISKKIALDPWWTEQSEPPANEFEKIIFDRQEAYNARLSQEEKLVQEVFSMARSFPEDVKTPDGVFLLRKTFRPESGIDSPKIELIVREAGLHMFTGIDTRGISYISFRTFPDNPAHSREKTASLRCLTVGWKDVASCSDEDVQNLIKEHESGEINSASISYVLQQGSDPRKYIQLTITVCAGKFRIRAMQQFNAESGLAIKDWELLTGILGGFTEALQPNKVLR